MWYLFPIKVTRSQFQSEAKKITIWSHAFSVYYGKHVAILLKCDCITLYALQCVIIYWDVNRNWHTTCFDQARHTDSSQFSKYNSSLQYLHVSSHFPSCLYPNPSKCKVVLIGLATWSMTAFTLHVARYRRYPPSEWQVTKQLNVRTTWGCVLINQGATTFKV